MVRKRNNTQLPTYDEFMVPVLQALKELGGSGTIEEINGKVYEIKQLNDEILQVPHGEEGAISEVDYRLAWARTYLKKYGSISNSERGVWVLTKADFNIDTISSDQIVKTVREKSKKTVVTKVDQSSEIIDNEQLDETEGWKEKLLNILTSKISPSAFERLIQRLLRESGFVQVEVTGRSGDGGVDGKGIVKISGFLSFHVIFQCKKYKGSVTPSQIRDFRGAMQGRADKGLFITTGTFTREAMKEASRDGASPIDLIDGESLCDKLKELRLGLITKQVEAVEIDENWFVNF